MKLDPKALEKLRGGLLQSAAEREAAVDPKKRFGPYVLVREVGRGGSGAVYQAFQEDLGRAVALKFLHSDDEKAVQRFVREARTAARLSHPAIVPIYEVGEHEGRHFIAMEYIDGQTLAEGRWEPRKAAEIMADVAEAVHFAHEQGVIHRDLKPQNLIRGVDGRVRVMDFGLAREVKPGTTLTLTGSVIGTPSYMPPEQAEGRRCDERSDVYSLGATLYELLAGRPPFEGETLVEILDRVRHDDPRPPRRHDSRVPLELETIVLRAMEKTPERRYASARAFADDLQHWLKGEPIEARPISAASRLWRKGLKNRRLVIPATLAVLTVLAAGGWTLRGEWQRARQSRAREEATRFMELANGQVVSGNLAMAIVEFNRAIAADPTMALAWVNRAAAKIDSGDAAGAVEDCDQALRINPKLAMAWFNRAYAQTSLGRSDEAIGDYGRAIEQDPAMATAYHNRASEYGQLKRWAEAIADYDTVIRLKAGVAKTYNNRANAYIALGNYDQALADYAEAIRLDPRYATAYGNRGRHRLERGEVDDAIADLTTAVQLNPVYAIGYASLGQAFYVKRDYERAIDYCKKALALNPQIPEAYASRAGARLRMGDEEGAIQDLVKALDVAPADWKNRDRTRKILDDLRKGREH